MVEELDKEVAEGAGLGEDDKRASEREREEEEKGEKGGFEHEGERGNVGLHIDAIFWNIYFSLNFENNQYYFLLIFISFINSFQL